MSEQHLNSQGKTRIVVHYFSKLVFVVVMLTSPLVMYSLIGIESDSTGFLQWLPQHSSEKIDYDQFVKRFGNDEFLMVSWEDCTVEDSRLGEFTKRIEGLSKDQFSIGQVFAGQKMLEQLQQAPVKISRAAAVERLKDGVIGGDGKTTGVLIASNTEGEKNAQVQLLALAESTAIASGVAKEDLILAGPVRDGVAMVREMQKTTHGFVIPIFFVTFIISYLCLWNLYHVFIVMTAGFYGRCLSMALVMYSGQQLSMVLSVMPVLVYVLSVSAGVHLVHYSRSAKEADPNNVAWSTLRAGFLPCSLSAFTTSIGLLSLCISGIEPVRLFGLYSSISIMLMLFVLLAFVPLLVEWEPEVRKQLKLPAAPMNLRYGTLLDTVWNWFGVFVARFRIPIYIATTIICIGSLVAISRLKTTVEVQRMFVESSDIACDYRWIDENIAPMFSAEVVFSFDQSCELEPSDRVRLIGYLRRVATNIEGIRSALSAETFLPKVRRTKYLRDVAKKSVFNTKFESEKHTLVDFGYLARDNQGEHWRMTCRIDRLDSNQYQPLLQQLKTKLNKAITEAGASNLKIEITGLLPMMNAAQKQLVNDLASSLGLATILICPIMILFVRSFIGGLLAMIPNVFPIIVVFGIIGWMEKPIDVGIMLTASVAIGIAVDDTLHFMAWFGRGVKLGLTSVATVQYALVNCALPMFQTTMICGLGLLPISMQQFVPTREFVIVMFSMLVVALLGDLLVLPAILVKKEEQPKQAIETEPV